MAFTARTWVDFVDQVDATNFNDLENRINSAVSSAVSAISNSQTMLSGTVNLSGSNIVTVRSTTGNAFVIDASSNQSVQTQGLVAALSNSQASRSGVVNISGVGAVTVGTQTGNAFTISADTQSVQTQNLVRALSYSNTTKDQTVRITGAGNITVASDASGAVISGSQSVQTQNLVRAISASNSTFDQTVRITGAGIVTVASDASGAVVSASQSVQTQNLHNLTISGNTAGVGAAISSGTLTLAGGNNITVSQAGNAVTISGPNVGGAQTGISSIAASNTTYTSGQVEFTGSNMVTVKTSAGQRVVIDATQSVQPVGSAVPGGNTTGTTASLPFAGNVGIIGGANVTVSQSTGAASTNLTISAASQSVQPVGSYVPAGNTTGTTASIPGSGNLGIVGGNNITISQSTGAASTNLTISAASQSAQTQSNVQGVAGSNTTYNTGIVEFTGSNMVTVRSSANQRLVIDATQSVQPVGSAVPAGNTAGTTASLPFAGNVGIAGGANITISQSTGAASTNLTIVGGAGGAAFTLSGSNTSYSNSAVLSGSNAATVRSTTGNAFIIDVPTQTVQPVGSLSMGGNTTGTTANLPFASNIQLQGGNNITLSQSSGANSSIVVISAGAGGAGVAVYASDGTFSTGTVSISGTNNITVGTAASKILISGPNTTAQTIQTQSVNPQIAYLRNVDQADVISLSHLSAISKTPFYFGMSLPGDMTLNTIGVRMSAQGTATLQSLTAHLGVYTLVNSTSMNLLGSVAGSWVASTASSASWSGARDWVITEQSTHTALSTLSAGRYVFGMMFSAGATGSMNLTLLGQSGSTQGQPLGVVNPGTNAFSTGTSQGINALVGQGSSTVNAMPSAVSAGDLRNQGSATVALIPSLLIRS